MLCSQCGNENPASNRFCGNCGAKLDAPVVSEVSESDSRPIAPPLDLRDPTDPGHIIVPTNGRNATHVPHDDSVVVNEHLAHEVGARLDAPVAYSGAEEVRAEPIRPAHYMAASGEVSRVEAPRHSTSIHGPSLLGLNEDDDAPSDGGSDSGPTDYSYLYDDEGRGGGRTVNWRLMFALVILIGFAGVLAYMWSQGKSWNTAIIKGIGGEQQKPEQPPIVAKTEPTTPGTPEIAIGETQKDQPANATPQSDHTADKSAKDNSTNANPSAKAADNADSKGASNDTSSNPSDAKGAAARPSDTSDAKKAKAAEPAGKAADAAKADAAKNEDTGDEEDAADTPAPTAKHASAKAAKFKSKKASAAKSAGLDDTEADDVAAVHRADALLKTRSCNQAVDLLREAALHGNATARSRLGGLYATGHCVPLDRAEAYNWFTLAKDAGAHYSWIEHNRSMLWAQMSASERERVMRR